MVLFSMRAANNHGDDRMVGERNQSLENMATAFAFPSPGQAAGIIASMVFVPKDRYKLMRMW